MQSAAARSAFTLSVVHQRQDQRRITAVALLKAGQRVFLGLDNGVVEEHRCSSTTSSSTHAGAGGAPLLRLQAEKKVFSRQAVSDISAADAAARLVCLSEEGQVALVSLETFAVVPLPAARGAAAVCAQPSSHLPVLLGVALRAGKGRSKVALFSVLPGATTTGSSKEPAVMVFQVAVPAAVTGLAWAGSSLLCAVPGGYYVLRPTGHSTAQHGLASPTAAAAAGTAGGMQYQLTLLADHLTSIRPLLGAIPDLGLGLMAWEDHMVLVTDAAGAACREPLQLPLPPLALSSAGLFVVAVCDDGVYAFDRNSSRQVQQIEYAHDDTYVGLSQRLPTAADAGGRCICLATSSLVLWLEPVALEQQVRELLKRKRFDQALDLISSSTSDPHSQPSTPGTTPQHGQHRAATPTPSASDTPAAAAAAAAVAAAAAAAHSRGAPSWQQVALAQAGLLMLLDADIESGLSVLQGLPLEVWQPCQLFSLFPGLMARWLPRVPQRTYWGLHGQRLPDLSTLLHDAWELRLATTPRGPHQQQQQRLPTTLNPPELQGLAQQAKTLIATYLTRVRQRPGLVHADGIDTLLLQLLCDVGDAAAVEALLLGQHAASAVAVEPALRAAGRWHGLALLQLHAEEYQSALDTWRALAAGELMEAPSSTGAVADAGGDAAAVAVAAAAAAMASEGPQKVPLQLLLEGGALQWLLGRDAAASLVVLESRSDLPADVVLQLLQGCDTDLQWQYLYHQVYHSSSTQQDLHTQLGQVMIAAVAKHLPDSSTDSQQQQQLEQPQEARQVVTHAQLAAMAQQLPLLFAPNTVDGAADVAGVAGAQHSTAGNTSLLFTSAAGQQYNRSAAELFAGAAQGQGLSLASGFGGTTVDGVMPSASMLAASVSELRSRSSSPQHLPVAAIDAAVAAAAHPARASHQQQPAHLPTVHEQQQQQWQRPGAFGALAGHVVHPRQRLQQQQQQGFGVGGFGFLSLSGASAAQQQRPRHGGSRELAPAPPSRQQHQQQQQQHHAHSGDISRQLSSIAELLQQQQQKQLQQQQPGARAAGPAAASAAGATPAAPAAPAEGAQDSHPAGIRALPAGLGPLPRPLPAPAGDTDGSSGIGSSQQDDLQHQGAEGVAGGSPFAAAAAAAAVADKVLLLRCLLVYHLQASVLYDAEVLLSAARALALYPELALLHSRRSDHSAALMLLALLPPRLVEGAIAYCRTLCSQQVWLSLLELFLNPKAALAQSPVPLELYPAAAAELAWVEPDYGSACRVLNAEGASLNPLQLLSALPAGMPLHLAGNVLSRMLSGLQHRHRQGQVVRSLQRCRQLAVHAELVQLQSGRVLLTDDSSCHGCGRLIGGKVFVVLPSGVVMCSRCSGAVGSLAAEAASGGH